MSKYVVLLAVVMLSACGGKDGIDGKNGVDGGINSNSGTDGINNGSPNAAAPSNDWKDHDFHFAKVVYHSISDTRIGDVSTSVGEAKYYDEHNNLKRYCKTQSVYTSLSAGSTFLKFINIDSDSDCPPGWSQLTCAHGYHANDSLDNCVSN